MKFSVLKKTLVRAGAAWTADNTLSMGAALAYYAVFSISPLLIIALGVIGKFFNKEGTGYVQTQLADLIGKDGAALLSSTIISVHRSQHGLGVTLIGVVILFIGASGVFVQLQDSMNRIWGIAPIPGHFLRDLVKQRLASFGMVLGFCFLLLISLLVSAALTASTEFLDDVLPFAAIFWSIVNIVLSFAVATLLFASTFKYVPDIRINWNEVWSGAVVTAALFTVGKYLIGFYVGHSSVGSAFGAAGSLLVILAWVYYSSQILFFGAEFTKVYAQSVISNHGSVQKNPGMVDD